MGFTPAERIGDIVAQHPATARVLELHRIDYCCAGRRTLAEAAAARGLDAQALADALDAAVNASPTDDPGLNRMPLGELADHIERTHHRYLKDELPRLTGLITKVTAAHGDRHPELQTVASVFDTFASEMHEHMAKEEEMFFPAVRRLAASGEERLGERLTAPVRCLMHEHEDAGRALEQMRQLTHGFTPPAGACATYRVMLDGLARLEADTHAHVHKENNIMFQRIRGGPDVTQTAGA